MHIPSALHFRRRACTSTEYRRSTAAVAVQASSEEAPEVEDGTGQSDAAADEGAQPHSQGASTQCVLWCLYTERDTQLPNL